MLRSVHTPRKGKTWDCPKALISGWPWGTAQSGNEGYGRTVKWPAQYWKHAPKCTQSPSTNTERPTDSRRLRKSPSNHYLTTKLTEQKAHNKEYRLDRINSEKSLNRKVTAKSGESPDLQSSA